MDVEGEDRCYSLFQGMTLFDLPNILNKSEGYPAPSTYLDMLATRTASDKGDRPSSSTDSCDTDSMTELEIVTSGYSSGPEDQTVQCNSPNNEGMGLLSYSPVGLPLLENSQYNKNGYCNNFSTSSDLSCIQPFNGQKRAFQDKRSAQGNVITQAHTCPDVPYSFGPYVPQTTHSSTGINLPGCSFQTGISPTFTMMKPQHLYSGDFDVLPNYLTRGNAVRSSIKLNNNGNKYWGIASDRISNLVYVTDRSSSSVVIVDLSIGCPISRFGQEFRPEHQLYRPTGLAVDCQNKRLIVADKDHHRVAFFTLDGHFISAFGSQGHRAGQFNYPWDVDISPDGHLIAVADSKNHRVQFFDRFGNYLERFTVFEKEPFEYKKKFDYPRGVSFFQDSSSLFVSDFNVNNLLKVELPSFRYQYAFREQQLRRPQGITVDCVGKTWICDSRSNCLRVVSPNGDLLDTIGTVGDTILRSPADCTVINEQGHIAVLTLGGEISILQGTAYSVSLAKN